MDGYSLPLAAIDFEVYRVEYRPLPDAVDFWDFASEKAAKKFIEDMVLEDSSKFSIRQLSENEIIDTAVSFYHSTIKENRNG